jgi:hypothetical protein
VVVSRAARAENVTCSHVNVHAQLVSIPDYSSMLRPARRTTPDLLLVAGALVVLAGCLVGVMGMRGLAGRADALAGARAETAHQIRLETAQTKLVIANVAADDDVLLKADPTRLSYRTFDLAMQPALLNLVVAADVPQDAGLLAVANRYVSRYAMQVENARTLARGGRPDSRAQASAALTLASSTLDTQVLPRLQAAEQASQKRLQHDLDDAGRGPLIALLFLLLALAVLGGVHWWLTQRTRRILNLGLIVGMVLLLVIGVVAFRLVSASRNAAAEVRTGPLQDSGRIIDARTAAFNARSIEALGVLSGRVAEVEPTWQASMRAARSALDAAGEKDLGQRLNAYQQVHSQVVASSSAGDTASAIKLAARADLGGSVGSFEDFDAFSGALLARKVEAADDGWVRARGQLAVLSWFCLAAGLLAAVSGWAGMAGRRREYR